MRILITGYSFIYQRFFKMFDYFPEDFQFVFILPADWKAKKGKVVYQVPVSTKHKVIATPAYFYHSNYPIIGGLLKGWQPSFRKILKKILKDNKIDLIYNASEPHLLSTRLNSLAAKKLQLPQILFSWENIHFKEKFSGIKLKIFEFLIRKNLTDSTGLICGNKKAREIFNSYNHQLPKVVCPLSGVDTDLFKPTKKPVTKITFLFAGALGQRKGIFLIIEAFYNLIKKYSNLELIFCGTGEDEERLKSVIEAKNLTNKIKFFKWLPPEELAGVFSRADIFLYPSIPENGWEEQFGFAMAEASATGLPVIATNIGSINEVVIDGQTGLLIEPNSAESLEKAMENLINNRELRINLGLNGRHYILEEFSYKKVAEKLTNFFYQIKKNV